MNLLIATDHLFFDLNGSIYDNYCFDQDFYNDYLKIFENITVITRVKQVNNLPKNAFLSSSDKIHFSQIKNIRGKLWFIFADMVSKKKIIQEIKQSDAIVCRVPSELGRIAAKEAKKINKPYMVEVIGDPEEAWKSTGSTILHKIAAETEKGRLQEICKYASIGSYVDKNFLPKKYPVSKGVFFDSISSIRLSDTDIQKPRNDFSITRLNILHVGRLEKRKHVIDLLDVVFHANKLDMDIFLNIVGDGSERVILENHCRNLGVSDRVKFYGHVSDKNELNKIYRESDLFILTSASEGLPRVILEAMANGLPVFATNIPGANELVKESELFDVGNIQQIIGLLDRVIKERKELEELSDYSINMAKSFTDSILSPKRVDLYRKLRSFTSGDLNE